jgi:ABC-type nitrate/sulfonate/bicarbonate transport system ATPase subunit
MSPGGVPAELDVRIAQKNFSATLGGTRCVIADLVFRLAYGEVGALIGPSGCGKTTLLRIIAGLDRDYVGTVQLPHHGKLGVMFQEPRLLPWRTVEENVQLAAPNATPDALAALFDTARLTTHRRHYPGELSLGLARRVALARAFAVEPDLLLLDEPFVSLDQALAAQLGQALVELVARKPVTTLLVTHDVDEAIGLADRLFVLSASPCRVIGDVPIETPRSARTPLTVAAVRAEIARIGDQAA